MFPKKSQCSVWSIGQFICNGKYTIEEVLSRPPYGLEVLYLVQDRSNVRFVVKTLNLSTKSKRDFNHMNEVLVREALFLEKVKHSNVVGIERICQHDGFFCVVMEYVAGTSLDKRDRRKLEVEDALNYVKQIGSALATIHKNGICHRGVQPSNIIVRSSDKEAVLISCRSSLYFEDETSYGKTIQSSVGFAAPEAHVKQAARGSYTDIYSLGATLYDLLVGTPPLDANKRKPGQKLMFPVDFDAKLKHQIDWAMSLKPKDRPKSIDDWLGEFRSQRDSDKIESRSNRVVPSSKMLTIIGLLIAAVGSLGALLSGVKDLNEFLKSLDNIFQPDSENIQNTK